MRVRSLGWEDSPGAGNGNPLKYSCLENSMGRGAWWSTVHGVTKSQHMTWQLNNLTVKVILIAFIFFWHIINNNIILLLSNIVNHQ